MKIQCEINADSTEISALAGVVGGDGGARAASDGTSAAAAFCESTGGLAAASSRTASAGLVGDKDLGGDGNCRSQDAFGVRTSACVMCLQPTRIRLLHVTTQSSSMAGAPKSKLLTDADNAPNDVPSTSMFRMIHHNQNKMH